MVRKGNWVACVGVRVGSKHNDLLRPQRKRVVGLVEEGRTYKECVGCRGVRRHIWGGREEIPMQRMAGDRR